MLDNMKGLLAYSGLATKVRAMQGQLLTEDDFQTLLRCPDIPAAAAWLRQQPAYAPVLADLDTAVIHRGQLEPHLRESVYRDFAKIYRFADGSQRKILELFMMRFETAWLKECLKNILSLQEERPDPEPLIRHLSRASRLPFRELADAASLQDLAGLLKRTCYHAPVSRVMTAEAPALFDFEIALDLCHFSTVWKERRSVVGHADLPKVTEFCGEAFDMLNLQWIRRCKKYYSLTPAEIYSLLIPVEHHLHTEELQALAEAPSADAADLLIEKTWYGRHFREFRGETLETEYHRILQRILTQEAGRSPYSISAVCSYLYRKEQEAQKLIIALECVRYQLSPEEAMLHLSS